MQTTASSETKDARRAGRPAVGRAAEVFGAVEVHNLRSIARGLAGGAIEPEDLLQDALERAVRHFDSFEVGSNLYAWLRTIMYRTAIDQTRARRRKNAQLQLARRLAEDCGGWDDEGGEVAVEGFDELGTEDVRAATAELSPPLRDVFRLFALEGLSYDEVAERLQIPAATVGTRLFRARMKLRELLTARAAAKLAPVPITSRRRAQAAKQAAVPAAQVPPVRRCDASDRLSA